MKYQLCINNKSQHFMLLSAKEMLEFIETLPPNTGSVYSLYYNIPNNTDDLGILFQATDESKINLKELKIFLNSTLRKSYGFTKEKAQRISENTEKAYKDQYGEQ